MKQFDFLDDVKIDGAAGAFDGGRKDKAERKQKPTQPKKLLSLPEKVEAVAEACESLGMVDISAKGRLVTATDTQERSRRLVWRDLRDAGIHWDIKVSVVDREVSILANRRPKDG